jgi:toluene monooxygenase system ferredoxin subunit
MTLHDAGSYEDLWDGERVALVLGGRRVFIVRFGDDVRAYEDRCAHRDLPLSHGRLEGCVLTCPVHEWQYDLRTGEGVNPRSARLRPCDVLVREGRVLVDVAPGSPEP